MYFYSKEALIEIYTDTKSICSSIPVPHSEKSAAVPFPSLIEKRGTIIVEPLDTVSALIKYSALGKTAILNMANSKHKGGGVERGAMAQEECLFRCSNLFTISDELYPMATNELIYTQGASFVKDVHYNPMEIIKGDVITIAAPNLNKNHEGNVIDQEMVANYDSIMIHKLVSMLDIAALNKCDNIILGAWGCGAFKNDPNVLVALFNRVLEHKQYMFDNIVFAVINDSNSVGNNYQIFKDKIKTDL